MAPYCYFSWLLLMCCGTRGFGGKHWGFCHVETDLRRVGEKTDAVEMISETFQNFKSSAFCVMIMGLGDMSLSLFKISSSKWLSAFFLHSSFASQATYQLPYFLQLVRTTADTTQGSKKPLKSSSTFGFKKIIYMLFFYNLYNQKI